MLVIHHPKTKRPAVVLTAFVNQALKKVSVVVLTKSLEKDQEILQVTGVDENGTPTLSHAGGCTCPADANAAHAWFGDTIQMYIDHQQFFEMIEEAKFLLKNA